MASTMFAALRARREPLPGIVALVDSIPVCDFGCGRPGEFDFATRCGAWAHGCEDHFDEFSATQRLGVGMGQLWVLRS
jgi:hypothetical protein